MSWRKKHEVEEYVFVAGDPFPGDDEAVEILPDPLGDDGVPDDTFTADESTWIDGKVAEVLADETAWVDNWMALVRMQASADKVEFFSDLRAAGVLGRIKGSEGYPYDVDFLALFEVRQRAALETLEPSHRPTLARLLHSHPFEAELLRSDPHAGKLVRAVLAETPGPAVPTVAAPTKSFRRCGFCRKQYDHGEPSCPWCGASG